MTARRRNVKSARGTRKPTGRLTRRGSTRKPKRRILIVCDGKKTEPNYFRELCREDRVRRDYIVIVKPGTGGSARATVKRAIDETNRSGEHDKSDQVWCVIDVEGQDQSKTLEQALATAMKAGIKVVLSNPCFECWFLSHFKETDKAFATCSALIKDLDKFWTSCFNRSYSKLDPNHFRFLEDKTSVAIKNAKRVRQKFQAQRQSVADCNSFTEVYRLVEKLWGRGKSDTSRTD